MKNRQFPFAVRAVKIVQRLRLERWTAVAVAASFVLALAVVLAATQVPALALHARTSSWEAGTVAAGDYVVERDFQFVDQRATQIKGNAQEKLIPPVFSRNALVSAGALEVFDHCLRWWPRLAVELDESLAGQMHRVLAVVDANPSSAEALGGLHRGAGSHEAVKDQPSRGACGR